MGVVLKRSDYFKTSIKKFCEIKEINYNTLLYYLKTNSLETVEDYEFCVGKAKDRERIKKIKNALNSIIEDDSIKNCKKCVDILNINYKRINYLFYKGYSRKETVIYSWFYSDKQTENGEKILSMKKLKELKTKNYLKNNNSLLDCVVSCKLGNEFAKERLIELVKPIFYKKISCLPLDKTSVSLEDIKSESHMHLLKLVPEIYLTNDEQIGKYISKTLGYRILDFIKKELTIANDISLDALDNYIADSILEHHQTNTSNPLEILVSQEIYECIHASIESLEIPEQAEIYNLYFANNSILNIELILEKIINGSDICATLYKFQKEFLKVYYKEII